MGRASIKDNKSIYQLIRESKGYTREQASDKTNGILSSEKIEKIENGRIKTVQPEDILSLAKMYERMDLCNYFCTHECAIGKVMIPEIKVKELSQIAIETVTALNRLQLHKERLLEIFEDGMISDDEIEDFIVIKKSLDKLSSSIDSLELWLGDMIAKGKIKDIYK